MKYTTSLIIGFVTTGLLVARLYRLADRFDSLRSYATTRTPKLPIPTQPVCRPCYVMPTGAC
jgi:hypothetical protein